MVGNKQYPHACKLQCFCPTLHEPMSTARVQTLRLRAEVPERPRSAANGVANGHSHPAAKASRAASEAAPLATGSRFTEADLGIVSALVGLETISSTEEHCGSRSLYMFEQLTALDRCHICHSTALGTPLACQSANRHHFRTPLGP